MGFFKDYLTQEDSTEQKTESYEKHDTVEPKVQPAATPTTFTSKTVTYSEPTESKIKIWFVSSYGDIMKVATNLKEKTAVILNLTTLNKETAKSCFQFINGTAFTLGAKISDIADNVYLISPSDYKVEIEKPAKPETETKSVKTKSTTKSAPKRRRSKKTETKSAEIKSDKSATDKLADKKSVEDKDSKSSDTNSDFKIDLNN